MTIKRSFTRALALAAVSATALMAGAHSAAAQPDAPAAARTHFDIPAQPLGQALMVYSRQARVAIAAPAALVAGKRSRATSGQMSPDEALAAMLNGTGLAPVRNAAGGLTLAPETAGPQSPEGVSAVEADLLEEVVVTAQKRTENIQDVPASISVIGGKRLETLGATQLADYAAYVPGLIVDGGGSPGQARITLRGLSPLNSTSMVGTYIDDSPLGSSAGWVVAPDYSLDLMPYDIERIEVLRGPQGTLYGANTMGGLVKYVTKAPDPSRFTARVGAEVSTMKGAGDLGWGLRAGLNVPLVEDKVAVSITGFNQVTPGYVDNVILGHEDDNEVQQRGGRLALLARVSDDLTLKFSVMGQDIDSDNNAMVSLVPGTQKPIFGDLKNGHFLEQPFSSELRYYTAAANWDLGWAELVSASSYATTDIYKVTDNTIDTGSLYPFVSAVLPQYTGGVIIDPGLAPFELATDVKKFTQEFRLSSPSGQRLEWLVGAYYTKEDSLMSQRIVASDFNHVVIPGFDPFYDATFATTYKELAAFATLTYKFTDQFDVSVGGRYSKNEQDFRSVSAGAYSDIFGILGTKAGTSEESVFTYSIAPRLHVSEDTMVYARIASGYRPGGPNTPAPNVPPQVDSDRIVNYEVGIKSALLDRRLMIDVAAFRVNWDDIQVFAFNQVTYLANGGKARSQGVEFNAAYIPTTGLRLGFNFAYTDAELLDPAATVGGAAGDQLPYTPKWSGAFTIDYEVPLGDAWTGEAGGGVRYVGDRRTGFPAGFNYAPLESYAAVDLHAGVSNDRWGVRLFVKNATDTRAYLSPAFSATQTDATLLQPRTIGLALEAKF